MSQTVVDTVRQDPAKEIEKTLEQSTQDAEDSQLVDILSSLLEHPLDVNTATREELTQVPGITPMLAYNIVARREQRKFQSVGELVDVDGMTDELLEHIRSFVTITPEGSGTLRFPLASMTFRTRTSRELQAGQGFLDGTFQGSPWKIYSRFTGRSKTFGAMPSYVDVGVLTEKDPGELSLTNFIAAYANIHLAEYATRIIVGDYTIEAGEALVLWRSAGFSKGTEVVSTVKKGGVGIRPYLSTDESSFFRGIAATTVFGLATVTVFFSSKPVHATINSDGMISNLSNDGLFRTVNELKRMSSAHAQVLGGRMTFTPFQGLQLGASGYQATFNHEMMERGIFGIRGNSASTAGLDLSWTQPRFTFFSEIARSHTHAVAAVVGLMSEPCKNVELIAVARHYPKDFIGLYSNGFSESHSTQNESGLYLGGKLRLSHSLSVSAYYDQFSFPWRFGSLSQPSSGNDFLLAADLELSSTISFQLEHKQKNKPADETLLDEYGRTLRVVGERQQSNNRLTLECHPSIVIRTRSRIEVVNIEYAHRAPIGNGFLAFQDVRWYPLPVLLMEARLVAFEADSFDSRVYEYEDDLRGTFSNPALFGKGMRWYLMMRVEITKSFGVSLKYSQTQKDGRAALDSGSELIPIDFDNRLSLQLDIVY